MICSILDNQLRGHIRKLVRKNLYEEDIEKIVLDYILQFHFGDLSESEKAVCRTILEIQGAGRGAFYQGVVEQLHADSKHLFPSTRSIKFAIEELSSRGIIYWKVLLNQDSSNRFPPKWECLNIQKENEIFAATFYGSVIGYEMRDIDGLDSHYYQDSNWLNILCPPKGSDKNS